MKPILYWQIYGILVSWQ